MTAGRLSVVSVVHDPAVASRFLVPSLEELDEPVERFLLANEGNVLGTGLATLYNVLMRLGGPLVRAFVHPDVTFAPDLVGRLFQAMDVLEENGERWGALGIVGRSWEGDYVWSHELDAPAPVCTLDSCFLVTRTDLPLSFDAHRFDDLHCVVEDYCLQCHAAGYGVWVVPVGARHESATHTRQGSRWGGYDRYRKRLERKWRTRFPGLTTT